LVHVQHTATHCNTLQRNAPCDAMQHNALYCNSKEMFKAQVPRVRSHCNTLELTATHCNARQLTATHGNTLQHTLFLVYPRSHIHTYAHTCTHTCTRACDKHSITHMQTCTRTHAHAHTFLISLFSTFTHTLTHAPTQLKARKLCIHKHSEKNPLHAQTTSANTNTEATKNENHAYTFVLKKALHTPIF